MECNQRSSSSSGTSDNQSKVLLKFKIPKNCSSAVDEQARGSSSSAENVNNNTTKRVCPDCSKEFESAKALGGHMRIHAQPVNKQHRLFKNYSRSDSDNFMSDYSVACSFCDKKFTSMKSLFGHMRCHPERDWRGIRPPSGNYSLSSSEDDDDEEEYGDDGDRVVDCTQLMPKWPVKAKRGSLGIVRGLSVGDEDDEGDNLRACVTGLLMLNHMIVSSDTTELSAAAVQQINGGDDRHQEKVTDGGSWLVSNREQESGDVRGVGNGFVEQAKKVDDHDTVPVLRKLAVEEGGSSDHVMKDCNIGFVGQEGNAAVAAAAAAVAVAVSDHVVSDGMNTELVLGGYRHLDGINDKDNHGEKMVMVSGKNNNDKKMKMKKGLKPPCSSVQVVGASTATDKYKCNTCDKTFSTHQALGGHRSSHNKFKVTIINGDSSTKKSVSAFDHQQPLNTSHDQVNRVPMSDEECAAKRNSIQEVGGSSKAGDHISSTAHQCSVCNKIFASGQALGGHKRCHWTAPAADAQTEEQAQPRLEAQLAVKSSGEEPGTQAGCKRIRLMGFDLTVPASMVDNAAQDGTGASW